MMMRCGRRLFLQVALWCLRSPGVSGNRSLCFLTGVHLIPTKAMTSSFFTSIPTPLHSLPLQPASSFSVSYFQYLCFLAGLFGY